jgi:hypothetical protein
MDRALDEYQQGNFWVGFQCRLQIFDIDMGTQFLSVYGYLLA